MYKHKSKRTVVQRIFIPRLQIVFKFVSAKCNESKDTPSMQLAQGQEVSRWNTEHRPGGAPSL